MKTNHFKSSGLFLLLNLLTIFSRPCYSQEIIHRNYDVLQGLSGYSMSRFDNGDLAHIGSVRFYSGNNVSTDPMFMKTDSLGLVKWALGYDMPRTDNFLKAVLLPNQSIVALGSTESYGPYGLYTFFDTLRYNILIAKIDSSGTPVQVVVYGDTLQDQGTDLIYSNSGDLIMLAMSNFNHSIVVNRGNMLLTRMDTSLNIINSKEFYFGTGVKVLPDRIVESNGYYYVSGIFSYTDTVVNWSDAFLIKLDQNFDIQWSIRMGSDENYFHTRILPHPDNGVYIGFNTSDYGTGPTYRDFVICHIDTLSQVNWSKRYGGVQFGDDLIHFLNYNHDSTKIILGSGSKFISIDLLGNILETNSYSLGLSVVSVSGISKDDGGLILNCRNASSIFSSVSLFFADSTNATCSGNTMLYPSTSIIVSPISINLNDSSKLLYDTQPLINVYNLFLNTVTYCVTSTNTTDLYTNKDINMYPNPTNDIVNFEFINRYNFEEFKINIYDQLGRSVFVSILKSNSLDISHLINGMYFIELFNDKEKYSFKAIKY